MVRKVTLKVKHSRQTIVSACDLVRDTSGLEMHEVNGSDDCHLVTTHGGQEQSSSVVSTKHGREGTHGGKK